jgi:hypothetical protein
MATVEESTQQRLMRERARALATLLLTGHTGVDVDDVTGDIGIDLVARITTGPGLRQLGVELRYVLSPVTAEHANHVSRHTLKSHLDYGPFPFPVVMFLFTMADDAGWYTWIAEPVVTAESGPHLPLRDNPDFRPLNDAAVTDLLARVNQWYDAFYASSVASRTGG